MDGITAIRQLMLADSGVTAFADETHIVAGALEQGSTQGFVLNSISTLERNVLGPTASKFVREMIEVTAIAQAYDTMKDMLFAARNACADKRPTVPDITQVAVLFERGGPDIFDGEPNLYSGSFDFLVMYNRAAP